MQSDYWTLLTARPRNPDTLQRFNPLAIANSLGFKPARLYLSRMNWRYIRCAPWLDTRAPLRRRNATRRCAAGPGLVRRRNLGPHGAIAAGPSLLRRRQDGFAGKIPHQVPVRPRGLRARETPVARRLHERDYVHAPGRALAHAGPVDPVRSARLLAPGGRVYFETPHPKSLKMPSPTGKAAGTFTLNFFDDPTHVKVVTADELAAAARRKKLDVVSSGISPQFGFRCGVSLVPLLPCRRAGKSSPPTFIGSGWSAYLIAQRRR